ncbi:uncharacterized protein LOC123548278, partial [Mercenaria mercenaria]|uniref:uncharacterized protein LOC123548278 n=1 Tax=Mercenaria mercenaria TaxID=6596 RepID=UPI00234F4E90
RTNRTSKTGGWCFSQSKGEGGQHRTDKNLVTALIRLLKVLSNRDRHIKAGQHYSGKSGVKKQDNTFARQENRHAILNGTNEKQQHQNNGRVFDQALIVTVGTSGRNATARTNRTSKTGGWCFSQSKGEGGQHRTDKNLVTALIRLLKGRSIGSFGDGPGLYKQFFLESNEINVYDAYDGAPFCEITSHGRVKFLDLTLPQYGLPIYDWILSIEVAEHIPKEYESVFISNIVRHAREGVILSWASPGQSGYSHINNRPFLYVKDLMNSLGFTHDEKESDMLKSATGFRYLTYNLNVYRRLIPPDVLQL